MAKVSMFIGALFVVFGCVFLMREPSSHALPTNGGGSTCCIDGTLCYPCGSDGGGYGGGGPGGGGGHFGCYNCRTSGTCQPYYFGGTDCSEVNGAGVPGCYLYNPCTGA